MQVCPHCGKETRASNRYCLHCGQRVDAELEASTPPPLIVAAVGGGWTLAESAQVGKNGGSPAGGMPASITGSGVAASGAASSAESTPKTPPHAPPSAPAGKSAAPRAASGSGAAPAGGQPDAKAWLVLEPRPNLGESARTIALDGSEATIGRAPNCQVVLADDQLASRRHATLRSAGDGYTIADLGSSNGTYVNGTEVRGTAPVRLKDGDRITVGEHEIVYATTREAAERSIQLTTDGLPVPVPPRWPRAAVGETEQRMPTVAAAMHPTPAPQATAPDAAPAGSGAGLAEASRSAADIIEHLQAQLVDASAALARRAEAAEQETERLRSALGEMSHRASDALTALGSAGASGVDLLDELIRVAKQAEGNPRHLDYLTALAERAGGMARALERERALASALEELRDRSAGLIERGNG